ncbi:MAG TPA: hypothetical protein VMA77_19880 [Solirubrobacteraceae bacterium]|nr:hypothetical protein [Solirubrobacteraceae bacterium]
MDDRNRPDTNVVLLRRKGDPSEAERERVASTIFAEPDDIATFSRGNLVPPRPDTRDDAAQPAPSPDPFFDRVQETPGSDGTRPADPADGGESTDAYFDRLVTQTPAEMSPNGGAASTVTPMPGSAQLPAEIARPGGHNGRLRRRLDPPALAIRPPAALRRPRFAWLLSAATIAVLAALVAGIAAIGDSGSPGTEQQQSQREASANSLEPLRPDLLTASANPFAVTALLHRSVTHGRRARPSNSGRPRNHRPGATISSPAHTPVDHRVVTARYTAARDTLTSPAATPNTQSNSATGSTPPASPTHYTNSSNSGSSSGSGSASPSQATLRSLVTGAGTCGCQ